MDIRRSEERGHANHGWLDSHHTFSFAGYFDPRFMGFSDLRVINEDRVAPGRGFGTHPHQNMEIVSYVLEGKLQHRDSMGTGSVIEPGDVQLMSAGTGVTHSEFNGSGEEPVHFLQIWIQPAAKNTPPRYQQKHFDQRARKNAFRVIVSPDGRDGSLEIGQDAVIYSAILDQEQTASLELNPGRSGWLHVIRGAVELRGERLNTGDAVGLTQPGDLEVSAIQNSELLFFDLRG